MVCASGSRAGNAARGGLVVWAGGSSILLLEEKSREVLAAGLAVVVVCSRDGSLGRPPSPLDREVLDVVRVRCDLAEAAASLACADASRSGSRLRMLA